MRGLTLGLLELGCLSLVVHRWIARKLIVITWQSARLL